MSTQKIIIPVTLPGKCASCKHFLTFKNGNKCMLYISLNIITNKFEHIDTNICYNNYCRGENYTKIDFMDLLRDI